MRKKYKVIGIVCTSVFLLPVVIVGILYAYVYCSDTYAIHVLEKAVTAATYSDHQFYENANGTSFETRFYKIDGYDEDYTKNWKRESAEGYTFLTKEVDTGLLFYVITLNATTGKHANIEVHSRIWE